VSCSALLYHRITTDLVLFSSAFQGHPHVCDCRVRSFFRSVFRLSFGSDAISLLRSAEKIADYMGGCPVVRVPGRTHPVTPYYLEDVVELTRYRLDPHSDSQFVARSKRGYGARQRRSDDIPLDDDDELDTPADMSDLSSAPLSKQSRITLDCMDHHAINYDLIIVLLEQICFYNQNLIPFSSAILIFLPSLESIRRLTDTLEAHLAFGTNQFLVLPLHSTISNESQGLVFNVPRPGIRKIVIST